MKAKNITLYSGRYAYLKVIQLPGVPYIFVSKDLDQITIICGVKDIEKISYVSKTCEFIMFKINSYFRFQLSRKMEEIIKILNDENVQTLIINKTKKSYILISEKNHEHAIKALNKKGYNIKLNF